MRLKILGAVFTVVFIAVLVIGLLNLMKNKAEPVQEAALPPQAEAQPSTVAFSDLTGELLPGSLQPGITVIRRPRESSSTTASLNEDENLPDDPQKSRRGGGGSKRKIEAAALAAAPAIEAGVTKIGHRPTPEESKEMNEKGIIVF